MPRRHLKTDNRRVRIAAAFAAGLVALSLAQPAHAKEDGPNHVGAAIGGGVAGLICGGGTLVYAKAREKAGGAGPLLWHSGGEGPGWIGVFFLEHAGVGGLTGAFGRAPRQGFLIGGVVTCSLDLLWIVSAEVLARVAREDDEGLSLRAPPLGLAERGPGGWRLGVPPVVVTRRGAWMSLFAWRF